MPSAKIPIPIPALDPFTPEPPHPDWVRAQFPRYAVQSHASGPVSSVRTLHADGHCVEVITTYSVRIDGEPVNLHMMVDTDGRLWSHLCPYRTFATATELVRTLIEQVPDALAGLIPGHGHEPGQGHGHEPGQGHGHEPGQGHGHEPGQGHGHEPTPRPTRARPAGEGGKR